MRRGLPILSVALKFHRDSPSVDSPGYPNDLFGQTGPYYEVLPYPLKFAPGLSLSILKLLWVFFGANPPDSKALANDPEQAFISGSRGKGGRFFGEASWARSGDLGANVPAGPMPVSRRGGCPPVANPSRGSAGPSSHSRILPTSPFDFWPPHHWEESGK